MENNKLSGQQRKKLRDALMDAFPEKSSLEQLLDFELDKNLNEITRDSNLGVIVFELIKRAESEGWLINLVRATGNEISGNLRLQAIAQEILSNEATTSPSVNKDIQHEPFSSSSNISTQPSPQQQKILVLAANPIGTTMLRIDEELREIKEGLRRAKRREQFLIESAEAVRYRDIHRAVMDFEPQIIHFSGHGSLEDGLVFEDATGQAKLVDVQALAGLFELFADNVKCVVLNACYSEIQARAIAQHIDYVIGMSQEIGDQAAIEFAVGFYDALGAGRTIEFAHKLGCSLIRIAGISEEMTPKLFFKKQLNGDLSNSDRQDFGERATVENARSNNITIQKELQVFQFEVIRVNAQGREIERIKRDAQYFRENLGNNVTLEMVAIPGGKFLMGSPLTEAQRYDTESPQHEVTVPPFFMGKYPVTQAQWRTVAAFPQVNRKLEPEPSYFQGDNLPVEQISWYEAVEFCDRLIKHTKQHYRLPSESEWEYACRAGTTTPFHFGETITPELANYNGKFTYGSAPKGKYRTQTTPIGNFNVANEFGLCDMHGNVWEWCADHWHCKYEGDPTQSSALIDNDNQTNESRILRGGSWDNHARVCRSACRGNVVEPDGRSSDFGFRVVVSAARN
ncbi:MAG: SUMF1/EgtB/PvdO family nonheme iron enzyme [Rhizonema sp. NSF051]|nr:SUMF1/EgtB/PvdO family nonheme iron enzyme [Rhizonema sp. NSF051]